MEQLTVSSLGFRASVSWVGESFPHRQAKQRLSERKHVALQALGFLAEHGL